MSINLKKTLYLSCAALMLLGTGMTSANALIGQNNQVHASRRYKRKERRLHRVNKLYYPKGTYKGLPWKKAWNKYLLNDSATIWTATKYYTTPGTYGSKATSKKYLNRWINYRKQHNNKRAFTNSRIGFGTYDNLSKADYNMHSERTMSTKRVVGTGAIGLALPMSYMNHLGGLNTRRNTILKDDLRNGMLLGNWPIHGFTPHMLRDLHSVAIAAQNGQPLHHSFYVWYERSHRQPTLKFGGRPYTYNGKVFIVDRGTNGYGVVYQYNPKTRHYKRVSPKQINSNLKNALNNLQQATQRQQQHVAESQSQAAVHNPALSDQTKQIIQNIINEQKFLQAQIDQIKQNSQSVINTQNNKGAQSQQNNVLQAFRNTANQGQKTNNPNMSSNPFTGFWDNPANAYKQLANNNQISQNQRQRLSYMSNSIKKVQQQPQVQLNNSLQYYVTALNAVGAYDGLSPEQQLKKTQYLFMHPSILNSYIQKYHLNPGIDSTRHPSAQASDANHSSNNSHMKQGSTLITNNPAITNEQEQFIQEVEQLAKLSNMNSNN